WQQSCSGSGSTFPQVSHGSAGNGQSLQYTHPTISSDTCIGLPQPRQLVSTTENIGALPSSRVHGVESGAAIGSLRQASTHSGTVRHPDDRCERCGEGAGFHLSHQSA
ncbi:MAG TPA: hypothetical protein VIE65_14000, partial [Methylobacter sp.]